ncbi:MAG TPA: hypothetical protein VM390_00130, partial [Acidimicrobiales bacterium]|nr:hypothetical protein [Acidimicrobiales bacterium]
LPPPDDPEESEDLEEVAFELATWDAGERVAAGIALDEEDVPWRWEPGGLLVVRELDEEVVESILEELVGADAGEGDEWAGVEAGGGDDVGGDDLDDPDEHAQTAMGDIFVVADRLMRTPEDGELILELARLAAVVEDSRPPFGIDRRMWEQIAARSWALTSAAEQGDDEAVADGARGLRDYLREYV